MMKLDRMTLNGFNVIGHTSHVNCVTVMVDRGPETPQRYVVATWAPEQRNGWIWGHYCDTFREACVEYLDVSTRNSNR